MKKLILISFFLASCGPGNEQNRPLVCAPGNVVMGPCNDPTKHPIQDNCSPELWNTKNNLANAYEPWTQYRGYCR